jgi:hypothetical protein
MKQGMGDQLGGYQQQRHYRGDQLKPSPSAL